MTFNKPDSGYWDRKFSAFMHDPFDKVFCIRGHEERAAKLHEVFGIDKPIDDFWKRADAIAAGFERGQVPSFSESENKNGAINFLETPILTHPTAEHAALKIACPDRYRGRDEREVASEINNELIATLKEIIGIKAETGGYSDETIFKNDPEKFSQARFYYTHLVLRYILSEKDVAGLGALWHRLPADSRFPDHTIWQHNALTSAIYSCMELAGDYERGDSQVGLMVVSITPVQPFIAKARKLRDYWTGSVLLSWLAFEGMRWIIENLGPDHILYPSPVNQPLINEYLKVKWSVEDVQSLSTEGDVASLPNKFLFLIPLKFKNEIAKSIQAQIIDSWLKLSDSVRLLLVGAHDFDSVQTENIKRQFERQNKNYWDIRWAGVKLIELSDKKGVEQFMPAGCYKKQYGTLEIFNDIIKDKPYSNKGQGVLYSTSHSLLQSALAVSKSVKKINRPDENGEKCHLCGEFEVLNHSPHQEGMGASRYNDNLKKFWKDIRDGWHAEYDFGEHERLCSVCLTKRIAYKLCRDDLKSLLLGSALAANVSFPSTTEIALYEYFVRNNIDKQQQRKIADDIHNQVECVDDDEISIPRGLKKLTDTDRYYAILLMDGDRMGKLINGETIASTWEGIMHPELVARLKRPDFDPLYAKNWQKIFDQYSKHSKRLITPAIHASISESLGGFAIHGVSRIVAEHEGRLIYAGGDDVCAIMPVSQVLKSARKIKDYYISRFNLVDSDGNTTPLADEEWNISKGILSTGLGIGKDISISAAILICHHKENLSQMIAQAHALLDFKAKKECGRNACAIELRKRSGGSRYFAGQWNQVFAGNDIWDAFDKVVDYTRADSDKEKDVSHSLVYRLEMFRQGFEAMINYCAYDKDKYDEDKLRNMAEEFVCKQLERSLTGDNAAKKNMASKMVPVVLKKDLVSQKHTFKPEGLIVASFMSKGGQS
ncbi:MAG: type III-B CRISPR-associated protein Cas10/Cmr2 [Deltaproteobacteria bacterium]|nr:type III-B CRISPR-associated protein Cas10/Cmr2 [Deltaproteobacteria bacterium]